MSQAEERVEYQKLMEEAHRISTRGLEDDYRALMEFNNVVLAGHQTRFGMEFVTWEWVQNHTALCQGHHYSNDYAAAKRDFITRSGLLSDEPSFSEQQLLEIYRCVYDTLESGDPISQKRKRLLANVAEQIEAVIQTVPERFDPYSEAVMTILWKDGREDKESICLPCPDLKLSQIIQWLNASDLCQCVFGVQSEQINTSVLNFFTVKNNLGKCLKEF